jgi:hypothetical protein
MEKFKCICKIHLTFSIGSGHNTCRKTNHKELQGYMLDNPYVHHLINNKKDSDLPCAAVAHSPQVRIKHRGIETEVMKGVQRLTWTFPHHKCVFLCETRTCGFKTQLGQRIEKKCLYLLPQDLKHHWFSSLRVS